MKKILIINLRRLGDVYSTAHLVNSMTAKGDCSVSLLIFKESLKAASNLKNINAIHTIDRKEIITLKSNPLFSDGFALEQLFLQIKPIKDQTWDEVINYSNDTVGAYLSSYLSNSTQKITGIHFSCDRTIAKKNQWEMLFNDILPVVKFSPLHFTDCYHQMTGQLLTKNGDKLIANPSYNASAFVSISHLRKSAKTTTGNSKVIGIQLKTSDKIKDIPTNILVDLITLIRANDELVPLLIIAPTNEERIYAQELNERFNNQLFIAEANLQAVASILMNIDLLITPDTALKHIADLTDTPVLEVSLGNAPFLKQGTYSAGSLVLTDIIEERQFSRYNKGVISQTKIKAQDIMSSVLYFFTKAKTIRPLLSENVTLYTCQFDQLGARYCVVAGSINAQTEIQRLMTRQLISTLFNNTEIDDVYNDILNFGVNAATKWCNKEKSTITVAMKDLLGTLRALLQSLENKKSTSEFVTNLGKLIDHAETCSFIQIPVTAFKVNIEQIQNSSFVENAKQVETLLYNLKSDIQKSLLCIKHLEDNISLQKKDEFINKATTASAY